MKSMKSTVARTDEEEMLQILGEKSPVGVCIIQDGKFCYFNSNFPIAIGYTADELLGKDPLELIVPEDREMVRENEIKMLRGELLSPYQFRVIHKDGSIRWVTEAVRSIQYHGRRAVLGNYMEVTERKQLEEALKESEEKYRELANSITNVFFAMDEHLRYTYWNRASEILTGIRAEDAIGKSIREIFPDEPWRRGAEKVYRKVLKTQQPQTFVNDYDIDNRHYILEINAYPSRGGISVLVKDITKRKHMEDTLRESKERYRALFDRSLDCLYVHDFEGNFLDANETALKLLGYEKEDILHINFASLLSQDQMPKALAALQELKDTGTQKQINEFRLRCKDGSFVDIEVIAAVIYHEGKPYAIQGIGRDVTERNQAEEALRQSEERYRTILEEMEDSYFEVDLGGHLTFVNNSTCRDLGYSREELLGMSYKGFTVEEDIDSVFRVFNEVYQTGVPNKGFPWKTIRKDGSHGFAETSISLLRNDQGEIIGFRGVGRDITERKQTEEKLQQSRENYRALFDSSVIGAVVVDAETMKIVMANQATLKMFGFSSPETGVSPFDFVSPEDREKNIELLVKEVFEKDSRESIDLPALTKDGKEIWVSVTGARIMHKGRLAALLSFTDITERKRMEEALQTEKNKLQSVIDAMQDALTIQDRDYNIIYQNEPARINTSGDRLGEKCYRAYEGNENICEDCPIEKSFKDGKPHTSERQRVLPSGELSFWETISNPIRDAGGKVISCLEIGRNITDRKKQEQALADELTRRRILVDQSLDGIHLLDEDAKVVEANQRFADMLGYTPEEVQELHTWDWDKNFPPEKILEMGRNVDEKGLRLETKHTRKDGSVIDVDISISKITYGGQRLLFCISRDITERNRAEEALRQSEEKYRALFDSAVVGTIVIDAETTKLVVANQAAAEMLGFSSPEELVGLAALTNIPPEDKESISELMVKDLFEQDLRKTREFRVTTKDGREIWISANASRIIHEGRLAGLVSFTDITERKRADEALRLAAEEWRETFDSISDAISIHDKDFRILRANKAFADLFRKGPNEIINIHCYELHKGKEPRSGCPHQHTLTTGKPAATEFYESHLGKYLLESTSPIFNEQGEVAATVHITRDITEQKQQRERLMMTDRLASLGEMAAGTAHELNNPLTSIIGFSELLVEREVPDDIRDDLKLIYSEAQRAANVTKDLLTFARKHAPMKQPNQINSIIDDVLQLRAHVQKNRGIEIERHLAPDLPESMVDYFQMQQVFLNIIINAEYFMTEAHKKGTLTITTKNQNNSVMISFADDGPGISSENLKRLFDPFFTTKEAGKGTGLGLSICHGIVTEHGGQIYVSSQLGKGTTIFVELPIKSRSPY